MSTSAQIAANQANSKLSTGPKTEEGKAASSGNNLRHGLRSRRPLLPGEDPAEFETLRIALFTECNPQNEREIFCVTEILTVQWRLRRVEDAEHRLLVENPNAIADGSLDKLICYENSLKRAYYKASQQLTDLQKARRMSGTRDRREGEREQKREQKEFDRELHDYIFAPLPTRPTPEASQVPGGKVDPAATPAAATAELASNGKTR